MNTSKIYYDSEDNECSIMQMVKREPQWAANRVQAGEDAIARLADMEETIRDIATEFFRSWYNSPGVNTDQGFNDWWKINKSRFGFISVNKSQD